MIEQKMRLYIDLRRREVADRRRGAAQQTDEWAADGDIHELDRLEGWLNLQPIVDVGREHHRPRAIEAER